MAHDTVMTFDAFEIDRARGELRIDGKPVPLEPQVYDLIEFLASKSGTIVSRDDLIEHVWGGRIVSDSAIASRINTARTALGDSGAMQRYIKTVPRKGFRFEVQPTAGHQSLGRLHLKPSVAVLPFENLSGDPSQAYFSDGITDDVITALSGYDEVFVAARHSSFAFRDSDAGAKQIAQALGVQFIAEGSIRRAGDRIRVTARLIDPLAGNDLWAERYDRDISDIFEVQDEISVVIVNTLVGAITHQHHRRLQKDLPAISAYDHVLRAVELNYRMGPKYVRAARAEAEAALKCDPSFARAHALVAWTHLSEATNAWTGDTRAALDSCKSSALAGVSLSNTEAFAHAVLGWAYMWCDGAFERGIEEQRRAIETNPGHVQFRSMFAFSLTYAGRSEEALIALQDAMRLNPFYPQLYHVFCGRALFNLGRYEEAMPHLERIRTSQPHHANALAQTAACYAALGRLDEAGRTVEEVSRASPAYTLTHVRDFVSYAMPQEKQHFLDNLTKAGLPD